MSTIMVKTADQKLMVTSAPLISSGNKEVDFIEFDFDSSWDEFPERYCVFYLTRDDPYQVTIENDRCGIVQAMTEQEGTFCFGVCGRSINGNKIKTSTDVEYRVARGVPTDGATVSTWDDFWARIESCEGMFGSKKIPPNPPVFNTAMCTSFSSMFQGNRYVESVTLNVKMCNTFDYAFHGCTKLKSVTLIDANPTMTRLDYAFYNCPKLESIFGEIDCTNITTFGSAFYYCAALNDIRLKANTLSVNIDLSSCSSLSRESVLSVLAACRQIDSTQTVKFASAVYSAEISEQIMSAVNKGWTVAFGSNTFKPTEETV